MAGGDDVEQGLGSDKRAKEFPKSPQSLGLIDVWLPKCREIKRFP